MGFKYMWVVIAVALFLGIASVSLWDMKDDNIIEEVSEEVIETYTGVKIDLTPDSKEK